jgi:hypothetical protein
MTNGEGTGFENCHCDEMSSVMKPTPPSFIRKHPYLLRWDSLWLVPRMLEALQVSQSDRLVWRVLGANIPESAAGKVLGEQVTNTSRMGSTPKVPTKSGCCRAPQEATEEPKLSGD